MQNPFETIDLRLSIIESLISDLLRNSGDHQLESSDELLTVQQTAELLNLAPQTVYGLVSNRAIPHMKKGNRLYFLKTDIDEWLSQGRRKTVKEMSENVSITGRNEQ